ncbi:MAG: hypothetical protein PVI89_18100, partial [Desulfobacteraceae bacterium]
AQANNFRLFLIIFRISIRNKFSRSALSIKSYCHFRLEPGKRAIRKAGGRGNFTMRQKDGCANHHDSNCDAQLWQKECKCKGC